MNESPPGFSHRMATLLLMVGPLYLRSINTAVNMILAKLVLLDCKAIPNLPMAWSYAVEDMLCSVLISCVLEIGAPHKRYVRLILCSMASATNASRQHVGSSWAPVCKPSICMISPALWTF